MPSMNISTLVTGRVEAARHSADYYSAGMNAISTSLIAHEKEIRSLWKNKTSPRFKKDAPTCCRLILEQSMAALLGRIDPIRFIAIYRGALSQDFQIGARNHSSLDWSKDIIPSDLKISTGAHWTQETLKKGVTRSLLDGHIADYIFSSAHNLAIEKITDATIDKASLPEWVILLLKYDSGTHLLPEIRKRASAAHSALSKGMHFEFFKGGETRPESEIIESAVRNAIIVVATSSIYVHYSDIATNKASCPKILNAFLEITAHFS